MNDDGRADDVHVKRDALERVCVYSVEYAAMHTDKVTDHPLQPPASSCQGLILPHVLVVSCVLSMAMGKTADSTSFLSAMCSSRVIASLINMLDRNVCFMSFDGRSICFLRD